MNIVQNALDNITHYFTGMQIVNKNIKKPGWVGTLKGRHNFQQKMVTSQSPTKITKQHKMSQELTKNHKPQLKCRQDAEVDDDIDNPLHLVHQEDRQTIPKAPSKYVEAKKEAHATKKLQQFVPKTPSTPSSPINGSFPPDFFYSGNFEAIPSSTSPKQEKRIKSENDSINLLRKESKKFVEDHNLTDKPHKESRDLIIEEFVASYAMSLVTKIMSDQLLKDLIRDILSEFTLLQKEFLPLTENDDLLVQDLLDTDEDPNELLVTGWNIDIKRKAVQCLSDREWLNDEVINFYMNILQERKTNVKCHFCNTFFYTKLMQGGKYDYSLVRRWTKNVDVFTKDKIIIPVHLGVHWVCAVINLRDKSFEYYDSMNGSGKIVMDNLKRWLQDESLDKKKVEYDVSGFTNKMTKNIPQQANGYDCGMFTCKYASFVAQDLNFDFSQKNMVFFRKRLLLTLIRKMEL